MVDNRVPWYFLFIRGTNLSKVSPKKFGEAFDLQKNLLKKEMAHEGFYEDNCQ